MVVGLLRLSAIGVIAAAVLAVAACGGSSSSSTHSNGSVARATTLPRSSAPSAVIGRSTSVIVNPAITAALKHDAITVSAVAPAVGQIRNTVLVFPATGGQIVTATITGTFDNVGGMTFSHAGKSIALTSLIVDTIRKRLVAEVGRQQLAAFDLDLASLKRASGPGGTVVASAIKLTITPQLARSLDRALGVDTFKGGQNFGIMTLKIAVKR